MKRDPICGMTGVIERHGHWFCSEHCAAEFERRAKGAGGTTEVSCQTVQQPWYFDPWVWVPASGLLLGTASVWWPAAAMASAIYNGYIKQMAVPLLIGLIFGGIVDHFVPREYIIRLMSGPKKRVIARSTLLGFLASSCSHGCLALTLELYRKGASVPAVVSFLLASPWASMSFTLILLSLFGLKGLAIVVGALAVSLLTGLIFQRLDRRGLIETNPKTLPVEEGFSIRRDIAERFARYHLTSRQLAADLQGILTGMIPLGRMVLGWVQFGLILSTLLGSLVPHHFISRYLGPSLGGLLLTMLTAAVIEVCSEGTAPLAFELYRHTGALGNSFAFLMGGVVTDYTELGALWTTIGRRTVFWMLIVTLPLVLVMGILLNLWR